jgi:small conductance mechanosensitive channel
MLERETQDQTPGSSGTWSTVLAVGLVVFLALVGVLLYTLVSQYSLLPLTDLGYLRLALTFGLGVVGVILIGRIIKGVTQRLAGPRHAGLVVDIYRIVAYPLLVLVALYSIGINSYALLAGGTFAGLGVGLASQTALANLAAGVVLVLVRPFEPGDRLTFTTSQYSFLMPAYPPKFYSQDLLVPGFTGTVQDIGLMYTAIRLDEGPTALFPNSIVILGAVIGHNLSERWVRVKYEVPALVDPTVALGAIQNAVSTDDWVVGKKSVKVYINQATLSSYVISVDALCAGSREEPPRSALYVRIMKAVAELTPVATPTAAANASGPNIPTPPPSGPPPAVPGSNPVGRL